jgi:VanZ family protein
MALWAPVALYMALIFAASSVSHPPDLSTSIGDKGAHGLLYSGLAALMVRALAGGWQPFGGGIGLAAVAYSILYGATDEIHQLFVPNRTADVKDLAADAVGAAVAVLLLYVVHAVRARVRR